MENSPFDIRVTLQWPAYIAVCYCKKQMHNWRINEIFWSGDSSTVTVQTRGLSELSSPEDTGLHCSPWAVSAHSSHPSSLRTTCRAVHLLALGGCREFCQAWLGEQDWQKAFSFFCSPFELGAAASVLHVGASQAFAWRVWSCWCSLKVARWTSST